MRVVRCVAVLVCIAAVLGETAPASLKMKPHSYVPKLTWKLACPNGVVGTFKSVVDKVSGVRFGVKSATPERGFFIQPPAGPGTLLLVDGEAGSNLGRWRDTFAHDAHGATQTCRLDGVEGSRGWIYYSLQDAWPSKLERGAHGSVRELELTHGEIGAGIPK
jgi:hypothetical protein